MYNSELTLKLCPFEGIKEGQTVEYSKGFFFWQTLRLSCVCAVERPSVYLCACLYSSKYCVCFSVCLTYNYQGAAG